MFNLTGQRFGHLRVLTYAGYKPKTGDKSTSTGSILWLCQCDCGERKVIRTSTLRHKKQVSCGCRIQLVTHGHTRNGRNSPTRSSWGSMLRRCYDPKQKGYENYGGRGITVCARWHKFENFLADMGVRPRGKTLDRENVNKGYEPGNCRWATDHAQRVNKRPRKPVASPQADVAAITGLEEPV